MSNYEVVKEKGVEDENGEAKRVIFSLPASVTAVYETKFVLLTKTVDPGSTRSAMPFTSHSTSS